LKGFGGLGRIVVEIELEDGRAGEFDVGIDIGIASAFSDSMGLLLREVGWVVFGS
jgi:hypothetical protein